MNKKTKIVATIGPASSSYETMKELTLSGMNVIRLNMSHGSYEEQMEKVENIRKINKELNTNVGILLDTKGPEVRTGLFVDGKVEFKKGEMTIVDMNVPYGERGDATRFNLSYENICNDMKVGDIILLDDGGVAIEVKEIKNNEMHCLILNSGMLKDRRGVNVPGVTLAFDFMSEKDAADITWACENNFDFIAASFVRNANDLKLIREVIAKTGNTNIKVISKVESQDACDNLDSIIEGSDGIMVARGDLGVEVPAEDVPVYQKEMISKCNAAGKIVITATQMLESMQENPRPTRAEVSDVFNAVLDGTDAVMLSGESANGDYPVESVATQAKIVKRAEEVFNYDSYTRKVHRSLESTTAKLIAFSAITAAEKLEDVKLIITPTQSGASARLVSQMKPRTPILALTPFEEVCRSLAVNFGVYSDVVENFSTIDEITEGSIAKAKELGYVTAGDKVILTCGTPGTEGQTDLVHVVTVK